MFKETIIGITKKNNRIFFYWMDKVNKDLYFTNSEKYFFVVFKNVKKLVGLWPAKKMI